MKSELIALDTNILIRFVTQDDSDQTPAVNALIESGASFFVADLVLAECVWVLRGSYKWTREEVHQTLEALFRTTNVYFEDESAGVQAIQAYRRGGDLADHLILAKAQQRSCSHLVTLDQQLLSTYPDFAKTPS
jgi:predicted nucleic-acid-binding protein